MYIRRKVFSIIEDENGEERLFSTTEFVDEETYLQKEFGIVDKLAKAGKKIGKNLKREIRDSKTSFKLAAGKDLTAKEVEQVAAKERLAHQKLKRGELDSNSLRSKLVEKLTGEKLNEKTLEQTRKFWEEKAKASKGATAIFPGHYM